MHELGECPADLDEQRALKELLASKSLYGQEPANLASYQFDLITIARSGIRPRDPTELLPLMPLPS